MKKKFLSVFILRERQHTGTHTCTGQREREREREKRDFQAGSMYTISVEPSVGLELRKCEILTRAEIKS